MFFLFLSLSTPLPKKKGIGTHTLADFFQQYQPPSLEENWGEEWGAGGGGGGGKGKGKGKKDPPESFVKHYSGPPIVLNRADGVGVEEWGKRGPMANFTAIYVFDDVVESVLRLFFESIQV